MSINENIKKIRDIKGVSQKELANRLKISQAAVNQFENITENFRIDTLEKIAAALNVELKDIIFPGCDNTIIGYDSLNNDGKEIINMMINALAENDKYKK